VYAFFTRVFHFCIVFCVAVPFSYVADQSYSINDFTLGPRVQDGVTAKVVFQAGGADEGHLPFVISGSGPGRSF